MYKIGSSKVEITFYKENCGMLGYGRHFHYLKGGVETPQYSRAYVFEKNGRKMAFIVTELCFITNYLKNGILLKLAAEHPELGYEDANLMIVAQHTHSTAGGYTQHLIYNMTTPGFQQDVYEHYRDGIIKSLLKAEENLQSAKISYHKDTFDKDAEVAFNRSMRAYNRNPEIKDRIGHKNRHLALDRNMYLLRFDDPEGNPLGSINWFGVHTTSVSNRRDKVCYDNKGYAADFFEEYMEEAFGKDSNINMAFAQEASGDVSPNYIWMPKHREYRGRFKDDYESAAYNGKLQYEKARDIFEAAPKEGDSINGNIDYILAYFDMTTVDIEEEYTNGLKNQKTGQACFGMAFLEGTTDGQGAPKALGSVAKAFLNSGREIDILAARLSGNKERQQRVLDFYNAHRPKAIVMNLSEGNIAGAKKPEKLAIPGFLDPVVKYIKHIHRIGQGVKTPWVAEKLPLQIFIVGQLAFVGIPAEITTVAGQRLKATVLEVLKQRGVEEVILSPFANAYSGYITTPEEYKVQAYEGGHTLFGRWTLPAYQMRFKELARQLLRAPKERDQLGQDVLIFDKDDIWQGFKNPKVRVY
jgi:neutral ceramidase